MCNKFRSDCPEAVCIPGHSYTHQGLIWIHVARVYTRCKATDCVKRQVGCIVSCTESPSEFFSLNINVTFGEPSFSASRSFRPLGFFGI